MIVPMKKVLLLALEQDKTQALDILRDLGVMHIAGDVVADSADRRVLEARVMMLRRVVEQLSQIDTGEAATPEDAPAERLFEKGRALLEELEALQREREGLVRRREKMAPWGDFSVEQLVALREKGIYVTLCEAPEARYLELVETFKSEGVELIASGSPTRFAVISREMPQDGALPVADVDLSVSLGTLDREIAALDSTIDERKQQLVQLAASLPRLKEQLEIWEGDLSYAVVRDSMGDHRVVVSLTGFVPDSAVATVQQAAKEHAWAVFVSEPDPEDRVPTLLDVPRWARVVQPLFNFLSIVPGYHEYDVSGAVLFFFTIFFGMIVGDAGYGMLFLGGTLWGMHKMRGKAEAVMPLRFMMILSLSAIIWGGLNGNFFGIPNIPGVPALTTSPNKNANVEAICFVLALAQLSLGRFWQAVTSRSWRHIMAQIGWVLVLVGNFILVTRLLVYPGDFPAVMSYLYGIGIVMIALGEINISDIGSIFSFPFSVIGSFVDVLSYIRLFAVGMAGYYIAMSFNDMGKMLMDTSAWLIPAGILVAVFGHTLNIALAAMSVLVHGVRLNTLEFSNHIGMGWTGIEFKPFQKTQSK